MNCVICRNGELQPGKVTVTLEPPGSIVVVKDVPALVCDNCGDYYLKNPVVGELEKMVKEARNTGTEIQICHFAA